MFGAEVPFDGIKKRLWAFAVWTYDYDAEAVAILRLRAPTRAHLVAFIGAAQRETKRIGFISVNAWDVDASLLDATCGERAVRRQSTLPELCWLGDSNDEVEWRLCERYAGTPEEP